MRLRTLVRRVSPWAAGLAATLTPAAMADDPGFVPRQALVRLAPGVAAPAFAAQRGAVVLRSIPSRNIHQLLLPEAGNEPAFVGDLLNDPRVIGADLNFFAEDTDPGGSTRSIYFTLPPSAFETDPNQILIGSAPALARATGSGVVVAVIDSGVDPSHPLLSSRLHPAGFNFIDNTPDVTDAGPGVFQGHGTLVAGLIARVAPDARLMVLRVLDPNGDSTTFRVVQAIYHAVDHGAHVINLSLGTVADPTLLRDAVGEATARGLIVVAAAGNDDRETPARSPASLSDLGVLAVAATGTNDVRAPFSSFGPWVSLAAPGVTVVSTTPGGGFGSAPGTSFAAPLVSGAAALLRSLCPVAPPGAIRARILASVVPIDPLNPGFEGKLGAGRLDVAAAVGVGGVPPACACDLTGDARVTVKDLYPFHLTPADANADGVADEEDLRALRRFLRLKEPGDGLRP